MASFPSLSAKILLVDDDDLSRDVIAALLGRAFPSCEILIAPQGEIGLSLYREAHPALVITDLRMLGMSGAELIHAIRTEDAVTPILVVTGAPEARPLRGATEVILKTDFRYMIEQARRLLEASAAQSSTAHFAAPVAGDDSTPVKPSR